MGKGRIWLAGRVKNKIKLYTYSLQPTLLRLFRVCTNTQMWSRVA
jgi:hypothetical protein